MTTPFDKVIEFLRNLAFFQKRWKITENHLINHKRFERAIKLAKLLTYIISAL